MYRLHCFAQSGNSFKVAFLLCALGQPFETVFVDYMQGGATRDPAWRETLNEMGEAPVLEDGALRFTQSGVILTHLADKHGAYGGRTPEERREILRWLLFDNHKFTSYFASYRFAKAFGATAPDPAVMAWLAGRIEAAYGVVERHLSANAFMVGAEPTIADFSMSGYLFYPAEESGIDVPARYPHIAAWVERLQCLPGWAPPYEVLPGERIAPRW
ncbi:glutathione S-transferase [Variovorax sp. LjRoot290]|uniref:glutathione S-transferase family protein n=1 Tax=Variovorax sp. LjRoot290 TaxID=3342316 RepID=UPI003ECF4807